MNVRSLCLAILSMGDATGYEIKKAFEGPFAHIYEASFGSIYPALSKLTEEGLVTYAALSQEKKPDKKVYTLTQTGRLALIDALSEVPGLDRMRSDFLLTMMFANLLSPAHVSHIIDARLKMYQALLAELETGKLEGQDVPIGDPNCSEFVRGFGVAMLKTSLNFIEENRHLVEGASLLNKPEAAE